MGKCEGFPPPSIHRWLYLEFSVPESALSKMFCKFKNVTFPVSIEKVAAEIAARIFWQNFLKLLGTIEEIFEKFVRNS